MNKLNAMAIFVQIVDSGSLTKAAETLNTSLPTVVRTLANLEEFLKTRLLNRTTRKITLTAEGRVYLERCRQILFDLEEAELELSAQHSQPSGKLSITAPVTFGSTILTPLVSRFLRKNIQVKIDLLLLDRNVNLVEEGVDVAVRIGNLPNSSMIAKKVGHVRRIICGTPKLLNSQPTIKHPKDLINIPCISHSGLSHGVTWQFHEKSKTHNIPISGPLFCTQVSSMLSAVCDDLGLGIFLSYQVQDEIESGKLQIVLEDFEPSPLPVSVVYPHTKLMSTRVRVFVDYITRELRKELSDQEL